MNSAPSAVAEPPTDPNADLAGVKLPDAASPIPAKDYTPGAGWLWHMAAMRVDDIGGMSMRQLAHLRQHPAHPLAQLIETTCSRGCGEKFQCMRLFAGVTACDACREKHDKEERMRRAKDYWETVCPPALRDTDTQHAAFPRAQYEATAKFDGSSSLFLFGPTRRGKTRLALLLLKRCLVRYNLHVGVMWPEDLKAVRASNVNRKEWVMQWGRFEVLLWDDSLLTGAQDERITDALKDLLDFRLRHHAPGEQRFRSNIFTSQIGGAEYTAQADKFENVTAADLKRVEALISRLREACEVVSFAEVKPKEGEESF